MPSSMVVAYDAPVSRRPRTPKAKTKEFLTSFSVHVLRTRQCRYTHTHTRPTHVESREREGDCTSELRQYPELTDGKLSAKRQTERMRAARGGGWVTLMRRRQRKRGHLPYGYTHTHAHNEGAIANHRLKFQAREFSIFSIPPPVIFRHTFLLPLKSEETDESSQEWLIFFFFLLFLSSQPLEWIDRLFFSIRVCTSCVEELICRRGMSASQKWPSLGDRVVSNK